MNTDAPSTLHQGLRWSLPGAALLSIPITAFLQGQFAPSFRFPLTPALAPVLVVGVSILAVFTVYASARAIICCFDGTVDFMGKCAVMVFNFVALLIAVFVSFAGFLALIGLVGSLLHELLSRVPA